MWNWSPKYCLEPIVFRCVWLVMCVQMCDSGDCEHDKVCGCSPWRPYLYAVVCSGKWRFLADSNLNLTDTFPQKTYTHKHPPTPKAHSGSSVSSGSISRVRTWTFWMLGMEFLVEDAVKNVMDWNAALVFWTTALPFDEVFQLSILAMWVVYHLDKMNELIVLQYSVVLWWEGLWLMALVWLVWGVIHGIMVLVCCLIVSWAYTCTHWFVLGSCISGIQFLTPLDDSEVFGGQPNSSPGLILWCFPLMMIPPLTWQVFFCVGVVWQICSTSFELSAIPVALWPTIILFSFE